MRISKKNKKEYMDENSNEFLINKKDVDMRCIAKEKKELKDKENKK